MSKIVTCFPTTTMMTENQTADSRSRRTAATFEAIRQVEAALEIQAPQGAAGAQHDGLTPQVHRARDPPATHHPKKSFKLSNQISKVLEGDIPSECVGWIMAVKCPNSPACFFHVLRFLLLPCRALAIYCRLLSYSIEQLNWLVPKSTLVPHG